jgi:hypothetical protein
VDLLKQELSLLTFIITKCKLEIRRGDLKAVPLLGVLFASLACCDLDTRASSEQKSHAPPPPPVCCVRRPLLARAAVVLIAFAAPPRCRALYLLPHATSSPPCTRSETNCERTAIASVSTSAPQSLVSLAMLRRQGVSMVSSSAACCCSAPQPPPASP